MLTMWRVVGYRSSLIVWGTKQGRSFTKLYTLEKESSGCGWKFRQDNRCALVCPSSSVILHANVVLDTNRGQRFPFLLVQKTSDGNRILQLCRLDPYGHLFRNEYVCQAEVDGANVFSVCPGPSVVAHWNHSDRLLVLFPRVQKTCLQLELRSEDITESLPEVGKLVTQGVWAFQWLATMPTTTNYVWTRLLVLVRYVSEETMNDSSTVSSFFGCCFLCRTEENLIHSKVGMRQFFPPEYASVVTCIAVHWQMEICPITGTHCKRPLFALGTSYKQVLLFGDGRMLHCITMTTCPCSLQMLQVREKESGRKFL